MNCKTSVNTGFELDGNTGFDLTQFAVICPDKPIVGTQEEVELSARGIPGGEECREFWPWQRLGAATV